MDIQVADGRYIGALILLIALETQHHFGDKTHQLQLDAFLAIVHAFPPLSEA